MSYYYECAECGKKYDIEAQRYLCDDCSKKQSSTEGLRGVLEVRWDNTTDTSGIPLPVEKEYFPSIPVGNTPLWKCERIRNKYSLSNLYIKDDTCNPSGSFKDRASILVAAFAKKFNIKEIALASTGNAASSMASIGAAQGIKIKVFLPAKAPVAKRIQVLQYGAELVSIDGNYDKAFDESLAYTKKSGALSRNTAYNPLTIEGKKTVAFEIAFDLQKEVDHVFVPVGDGVIIAGVYKGFEDLIKLGRIKKMPTIWACQAEGSSAIARALTEGGFKSVIPSHTLADSISVDVPKNGPHALSKLLKHKGKAVVSNDAEILEAQKELSSLTGLFAEPSSCASYAGFLKAKSSLKKDDVIVVMITGTGLKDIQSGAKALGLSL